VKFSNYGVEEGHDLNGGREWTRLGDARDEAFEIGKDDFVSSRPENARDNLSAITIARVQTSFAGAEARHK
jgi:hypothetical protein